MEEATEDKEENEEKSKEEKDSKDVKSALRLPGILEILDDDRDSDTETLQELTYICTGGRLSHHGFGGDLVHRRIHRFDASRGVHELHLPGMPEKETTGASETH